MPPEEQTPALLHRAMRYSALADGKRFRPVLVYAAGDALGLPLDELDPIATAIEVIHAYSLIHDDLPAMDDDDLRRGHPTCHKAFDEATAILAGDALQALAFEILAQELPHRTQSLRVIHVVAQACGSTGMAGGQALDLAAVGQAIDVDALETMHRLKTGALIRASVTAPGLLAGAGDETREALAAYGDCIGLAFQVHDDILDITGDSELTGKNTLADAALEKPTFPSILGLDASRHRARELRDQAITHLQSLPGDTSALEWLAAYVIRRDR
ncbi:MAG: geranyl transferase [Xanthomonadales bacterium]|nr:polyprenyl synthetase family protein [Gammaproteobacteria bacterium]MBT8050564.1 polyprenyl synthetase family protein [Gammaproteobacteria bacterium]MBT8055851.1 polyprenyl synthetase family protein [Gammaproteobacteria bacterium]NNJ80077.1 geranyl transferase [Xanthomonadales bacterium]NNL04522.1 geranyl transferase [Xanthomonadales bacterium]